MKSQLSIKERGAHFTPADIAEYIAERALSLVELDNGQKVVYVLDPACGDGELLVAALAAVRQIGKSVALIGIDTDAETVAAAEARLRPLLREGDSLGLRCSDFLTCTTVDDRSLFSILKENCPENELA